MQGCTTESSLLFLPASGADIKIFFVMLKLVGKGLVVQCSAEALRRKDFSDQKGSSPITPAYLVSLL